MSQKIVDRAGRRRNRTVAFRVSEEEAAQIDAFVALSGLSKQEYCASRLLQKEVTVKPSSRLQKTSPSKLTRSIANFAALSALRICPLSLLRFWKSWALRL
ncbi:MAG: hypothetical protein RR842_08525 [Gordonibacter sp.]|uniref:plasmid mobilization protein n=1 Tax=Gordonibacter sp. TaxID=1968902 RepID=UPI002FC87B0A